MPTPRGALPPRFMVLPEGAGELVWMENCRQIAAPAKPLWLDPDASVVSAPAIGVPERGESERVLWSGSFAQAGGGGLFDEDPRTWGPRGWAMLDSSVRALGGERLIVRPHARHVVSDIPGCRKLVAEAWGESTRLLIDPMSMFTPTMLGSREREDHLRRIFDMVADYLPPDRVAGVIVSGGRPDDRVGVACCPLSEGLIDASRVLELARTNLPTGTTWTVLHAEISA